MLLLLLVLYSLLFALIVMVVGHLFTVLHHFCPLIGLRVEYVQIIQVDWRVAVRINALLDRPHLLMLLLLPLLIKTLLGRLPAKEEYLGRIDHNRRMGETRTGDSTTAACCPLWQLASVDMCQCVSKYPRSRKRRIVINACPRKLPQVESVHPIRGLTVGCLASKHVQVGRLRVSLRTL